MEVKMERVESNEKERTEEGTADNTIEARITPKEYKLTKEQIEQLEKTGIVGGQILESVDIDELKYVWNCSHSNVILLDLNFVMKPHQLVNLKKFFSDEELRKSRSLRIAVNSMGDLKLVKLEDMTSDDVKEIKCELERLEEQYELVPEGGTKIPLKVDRHNNPFFARLWIEEEKIMKVNNAKHIDTDPNEVLLHKMEGAI